MKTADDYFGLISESSDLLDAAQLPRAQSFMIEALQRVKSELPPQARDAAALASQFLNGSATAGELAKERVRLWKSIHGKDISKDQEVHRTLLAIHVLYLSEPLEMREILPLFLGSWFKGGLSEAKLAEVLLNTYGLTFHSHESPAMPATQRV